MTVNPVSGSRRRSPQVGEETGKDRVTPVFLEARAGYRPVLSVVGPQDMVYPVEDDSPIWTKTSDQIVSRAPAMIVLPCVCEDHAVRCCFAAYDACEGEAGQIGGGRARERQDRGSEIDQRDGNCDTFRWPAGHAGQEGNVHDIPREGGPVEAERRVEGLAVIGGYEYGGGAIAPIDSSEKSREVPIQEA